MERDPNKINDDERDGTLSDADRQIESALLKQGQEYAARNQRSKAENKGRAESRARIKEIGMDTNAFATAVRLIKDKRPDEIKAWMRDLQLTLKVMGGRQRELFPEEQLRAEKRAQDAARKKEGKPRGKDELDSQTDTNRRSDPAAGGAQVDIEEAIARQTAQEMAEGEALLAGKSDAWRQGFNAVAAGGERGSNPYLEGSAETRDWLAGFEAATQRAFEAAKPKDEAEPVVADGEVFNGGAGKPAAPAKKSQSAKAQDKRAKAGLH